MLLGRFLYGRRPLRGRRGRNARLARAGLRFGHRRVGAHDGAGSRILAADNLHPVERTLIARRLLHGGGGGLFGGALHGGRGGGRFGRSAARCSGGVNGGCVFGLDGGMGLGHGGNGGDAAFDEASPALAPRHKSLRQRLDIGAGRGLLGGRVPFLVAQAFQHVVDHAQALQRVFGGRRNGQEAVHAHRLGVADMGVVNLRLDHGLAEGDDGAALGKGLETVIGSSCALLHVGLLAVHIGLAAAALLAAAGEAGDLRHHRGADGLFEEVLRLCRILKLAEKLDVTVGGDGPCLFLHALFKGGQILAREDEREAERTGLGGHDRHAGSRIVTDLVEDGDERRGGVRGLVVDHDR